MQAKNCELRGEKVKQELAAAQDTGQQAQIAHAQQIAQAQAHMERTQAAHVRQIAQAEAHVQAASQTEARLHYERFAEKAEQGEAIAALQVSFSSL